MYRHFLQSFRCNLEYLRLSHAPLVYSLDVRTHNFSHHLSLSSVLLSKSLGDDVTPGSFHRTGPRSFNAITKKKLKAVHQTLRSGFDVLLSDADVFWCQDAARYIAEQLLSSVQYADADVLIQPEAGYRSLNSGFYYVRSNARTLRLFQALLRHAHVGAHDQDVVNAVFCDGRYGGRRVERAVGVVPYYCKSRGAVIKPLPAELFPSGAQVVAGRKVFAYSRDELRRMCESKTFVVVHNNFIRASKKRARFVVKGMWFADDDSKEESGEGLGCRKPPFPSKTDVRTCGSYC